MLGPQGEEGWKPHLGYYEKEINFSQALTATVGAQVTAIEPTLTGTSSEKQKPISKEPKSKAD